MHVATCLVQDLDDTPESASSSDAASHFSDDPQPWASFSDESMDDSPRCAPLTYPTKDLTDVPAEPSILSLHNHAWLRPSPRLILCAGALFGYPTVDNIGFMKIMNPARSLFVHADAPVHNQDYVFCPQLICWLNDLLSDGETSPDPPPPAPVKRSTARPAVLMRPSSVWPPAPKRTAVVQKPQAETQAQAFTFRQLPPSSRFDIYNFHGIAIGVRSMIEVGTL